jgi:hypothetical protein
MQEIGVWITEAGPVGATLDFGVQRPEMQSPRLSRSANSEVYIRGVRVATRKPANLTPRDLESATYNLQETHNLHEKYEKYGHMDFKRLLNRTGGIPARVLMRVMARRYPQQEYDGLRLVVADDRLASSAERFFSQPAATRQVHSTRRDIVDRCAAIFFKRRDLLAGLWDLIAWLREADVYVRNVRLPRCIG